MPCSNCEVKIGTSVRAEFNYGDFFHIQNTEVLKLTNNTHGNQ